MTIDKIRSELRKDGVDFNEYQFLDGSNVIQVNPDDLDKTLGKIHKLGLSHLSTIIGLQENGNLVSLYPLSKPVMRHNDAHTIFVKTMVPIENPHLTSAVKYYPTAEFYEREVQDLLGIIYGEKRDRLLLPDTFPDDIFPLRKDLNGKELQNKLNELGVGMEEPISLGEIKDYEITKIDEVDYSISIGPQHPTHKEPIRFQFFVRGEDIEDVKLRIGFNHRGIEKALEMNTYIQNLALIERICGICSAAHQFAYVVTADKVAGIENEVPERAEWIRVLIAELERIHSHQLWYGVLAHDAGYDMMFHVSWRDREMVMDLLEKISGNRVNYYMYALGGVQRDISKKIQEDGIKTLKELYKLTAEHKYIMENEKTFIARMADVGILKKEDAIKLNAVGPTARSSGINFDLRRDFPYSGYKFIDFDVKTSDRCDVMASLIVRLDETLESINKCIYILENLPDGKIKTDIPRKFPVGEAHTRVEAPRGEDIHYIKSDGGKGPYRHKVRAPTLSNIVSLLHRFKSMTVADIPMIIRLIDPCIGCMERVTFIDVDTNRKRVLSGLELIDKSNKRYLNGKPIRLFG